MFYLSLPVIGWTSASLLNFHRLCGAIEGRLSIFCPVGSRQVGRVLSARAKSLEILCDGWEWNPCHSEDRQ